MVPQNMLAVKSKLYLCFNVCNVSQNIVSQNVFNWEANLANYHVDQ